MEIRKMKSNLAAKMARDESESRFMTYVKTRDIFNGAAVESVEQLGKKDEDGQRIDVKVVAEGEEFIFDVIGRKLQWTGNYSVPYDEYTDMQKNPEKYKNHFIALAEYEKDNNNEYVLSGEFIICPTLSIAADLFVPSNLCDNSFCLLSEKTAAKKRVLRIETNRTAA